MKIGGFVYAVCGVKEHIDTLHISLEVLKRHSQYPIWVITDSSRNETPINWERIVDVPTPAELNNHQASIFLKTSVQMHLPQGEYYAYIDSDILAMSDGINGIFDQFLRPIRFAADHCTLPSFSPHAVHCGCLEQFQSEQQAFDQAQIKPTTEQGLRDQFDLKKRLAALQKNKTQQIWETLRFVRHRNRYSLDNRFFYDKELAAWKNAQGEAILGSQKQLIRDLKGKVKWNPRQKQWVNATGKSIWNVACLHLRDHIESEFGISVHQPNWQHWNGGVFVFGPESQGFLQAWHDKCLRIFHLPNWKTRDQGMLIATAWEFGLQDQELLPKAYNFLADANNEDLDFQHGQWLDPEPIEVYFAHVYHRFMDPSWPIWNRLSQHLALNHEPQTPCE